MNPRLFESFLQHLRLSARIEYNPAWFKLDDFLDQGLHPLRSHVESQCIHWLPHSRQPRYYAKTFDDLDTWMHRGNPVTLLQKQAHCLIGVAHGFVAGSKHDNLTPGGIGWFHRDANSWKIFL